MLLVERLSQSDATVSLAWLEERACDGCTGDDAGGEHGESQD